MPVSGKRKNKKSGKPTPARIPVSSAPPPAAAVIGQVLGRRDRLDAARRERARPIADGLVADLAASNGDAIAREDELCARLGPILHELASGPGIEQYVSPDTFARVLVERAIAAVQVALTAGGDPLPAWRALAAVAAVVPYGLAQQAFEQDLPGLRSLPGGTQLPALPETPAPSEVRWTRDRYGSRIGVVAAFPAGETHRWYLWDIDACTYRPLTVHSGYYASAEQAAEQWRAGVGPVASDGTSWEPGLLAEVMPRLEGLLETGGESPEQFAEYYRCRQLSYVVLQSQPDAASVDVDCDEVADEFVAWLAEQGTAATPDLQEAAAELADSWKSETPSLYFTCPPHRVAYMVTHLRNYYLDDFVEELIRLLPQWITWLAERTGAAPELVERCLPYARGEKDPADFHEGERSEALARVIE
ncbi:hypothetical protein OHA21_27170 [Actinoplanes sp. NBC_00393]|uniref:hypothetical protein n=1 Tax=Actinoplanes sp. NBC_00393 TaxID=2975953 RepID=UPI002E222BB4